MDGSKNLTFQEINKFSIVKLKYLLLLTTTWMLLLFGTHAHGQEITNEQKEIQLTTLVGAYLDPSLFTELEIQTDDTGSFVQIDDMRFRVDDATTLGYIGRFWYSGSLVYELAPDVRQNVRKKSAFERACNYLSDRSGLYCRERNTLADWDNNYVYVVNDTSNHSIIGRVGGKQYMGLHNWDLRTITHEILHAISWVHEQSRPDRGQYVDIHWENIQRGKKHNFKIFRNSDISSPYDFRSIMHYTSDAFSSDKTGKAKTITPVKKYSHMESYMGKSWKPTTTDIEELVSEYGPPGTRWCGYQRYPGPIDDISCHCDHGKWCCGQTCCLVGDEQFCR